MRIGLIFLAALGLCGCQNKEQIAERNVIRGTAPFFDYQTSSFPESDRGTVIAAVHQFANEHHMDFLVSVDGPEPGDFNASANGFQLNLHAMRVAAIDPGLDIFATARGKPTPEDWQTANEFTCRIVRQCSPNAVSKRPTHARLVKH